MNRETKIWDLIAELRFMSTRVGKGRVFPKSEKISWKVGTTLTTRKNIMVMEIMKSMIGYCSAAITLRLRKSIFSMLASRILRASASRPLFSPIYSIA